MHAAESDEATHFHLGFRPELDGIRGISIIFILLFHLRAVVGGEAFFTGGFIGVDFFFVLSGFLITSNLLSERRRHGRIDVRHFFARRILRLWPALFVTCVLASIWMWQTDIREVAEWTRRGSVFALLYVQNYAQALRHAWYGPVSHLWSVNVEEQFYLVWPALLLLLLRLRNRTMIGAMLALIAISAALKMVMWQAGVPWWRLYFAFETRADALLIGCLVALLAHAGKLRVSAFVMRVTSIATLVLLVGFGLFVSEEDGFPYLGGLVIVAAGCAAFVWSSLSLHESGFMRKSLRADWLTWTGARSYGLYLYHPLCYDVARHALESVSVTQPFAVFVAKIGFTLVIAAISYRYLELPMLRLKRRFTPRGQTNVRSLEASGSGGQSSLTR